MAALSRKLDEAKVEGERLKELASAPTPKATTTNWSATTAAAQGTPEEVEGSGRGPAPSTQTARLPRIP